MASQAKWTQMLSQFSSRDDHIAKPPPPKRQKNSKMNLQFSQLDVQAVESSTSKSAAERQKIEEPIDGWDSWSDDDNNLELDKLLSQYDQPAKQQNRQAKEVQQPKPKPANTTKVSEPATQLTVQVEISKQASTDIKKGATDQQQVSSQSKLKLKEVSNKKTTAKLEQQPVTLVEKNVKTKTSSPPKTVVVLCKEPDEIANEMSTTTIEEIDSLLDFNFHSKVRGSSRNMIADGIKNYVTVLETTQTLFETISAEMMNVALPYQDKATCKDQNFWTIFQFGEYSAGTDLSSKICHSLGKLVENNGTDRHLLQEAKKMTTGLIDAEVWSVSCNSSMSRPNLVNAPLLLQQICMICDIAALKTDATALGPVICASVKFTSSVLVTQDCNSNDLIMWILKRCCDIVPIPCVLYSLVEAIVQITATKPDLINQHCSYDFKNHHLNCFLSKIVDKSRILLKASSSSKDCQLKTSFAVQMALKMTDFMDTVHFTPSYKLPPCLLLSKASSCLQNLFKLVGTVAISSNISTNQVTLVESLSGKMVKLMHWLFLTENNKFKEFTVDLKAELYYFLMLRRGKLHPDECADAIEELLARYSVWGAAPNLASSEHKTPSSSTVSTLVAGYSGALNSAGYSGILNSAGDLDKNTDSGDYLTPCGTTESTIEPLKPPSVKKSLRLASRAGKRR